ncbi:MAG TPA: carboxypeptidase-like regulatory domain-containing protein [Chthoniobacterales bacterium]|nr:carboxypeptidase-like regulatory domain-containing protein [Chthoniobacterales bacterium]
MKNMTRGILLLLVACATSVSYGGQAPRGVAGVDVVVKQNPSKRAVTDVRGNFAFDGLAPGSYTLSFRAQKAANTKTTTTDKVTVATSYSIKIDGAKRSVIQSKLTGDRLLAGIDLTIEVGSGAKVRGQVAAGALKKMVWVPKEPGSHIPGYWAEEGTVAASRSNSQVHSQQDTMQMYKGNPNMLDPMGAGARNPDANPGR